MLTTLFTYCESTSTELVVWGDILPSNVGGLRFSPLISLMVKFPIHIKGMILGYFSAMMLNVQSDFPARAPWVLPTPFAHKASEDAY
jgi:hypothetical protein